MDLSILIPSRNEMFLAKTVENILENIEGDTEILVGLDGEWSDPPLPQHPKVSVIYVPQSIGQRAMTNQLARIAQGKYVMKVDAHCAFDKGFDVKMIAEMKDDYTLIPTMYNLHAFDWKCKKCGNKWYQGQTPKHCKTDYDGKEDNPNCDSTEFERDMVWQPRKGRRSYFYRFDNTLHFQYWGAFKDRPEAQGDVCETMSCQGSCFMLTKKKYFELDICDERHGSWGQQGVEVACKTWLSGGKLMVNKKTWYAHMFRTQGGDFGFPYPNPGIEKARQYSRDLWFNNKWDKAIHPLEWLIAKFAPVPDWDVSVGILYYSDCLLDHRIMKACQEQIKKGAKGRRIVSVTLKPIDFGDNIHLNLQRGYLTMAKQILAGLKALETDIVFFTEHDVMYHPSHFDFIPPKKDVYYYNTNVWRLRLHDGFAVRTDDCKQLSGLCANREFLVTHYEKRVKMLEAELRRLDGEVNSDGLFNKYVREMGFEPGTHNRAERVDDFTSEGYISSLPNVDLRHDKNLTASRWTPEQFKNQKYTRGWTESENYSIDGWESKTLSTIHLDQ